jgi:hypothetical protein
MPIGARMAFEASFLPLCDRNPEWGSVALLAWDEAIFGFPVAEFRPGSQELGRDEVASFRAALEELAASSGVELISLRLDASAVPSLDIFCAAGFFPVDLSEEASTSRLRPESMPKPRFGVRIAASEDHADILRIAGTAFRFGRYHTDPRFPRELADKRYVQWVRNALASTEAGDSVFVLGSATQRLGFFHVVLTNGAADLRLAAADPESPVGLGLALYSETILALHGLGARRFVTKVSAANIGIMNLYASLGFRFSKPEYILHWHAPGAPHLR